MSRLAMVGVLLMAALTLAEAHEPTPDTWSDAPSVIPAKAFFELAQEPGMANSYILGVVDAMKCASLSQHG